MATPFSHPPLPGKGAVSTGNEGDGAEVLAALGLVSSTETHELELTWRSPLSLRDESLLEEEWLPSSAREFPEPADGPNEGRLSPAGGW